MTITGKALLGVFLLCFGVAGPAWAQSAVTGSEDAARIARMEQRLPPAVVVRGVDAPAAPSLAQAMAEAGVPGLSVTVIRDGRVVWSRQYGVSRIGGPAVAGETRFQAGSISKSITALGAITLVETGAVSLDEDVNTRLSGWRLPIDETATGAPVTLASLLSHTAGTTVHAFPGYRTDADIPTLRQVLDGAPPANTAPVRVTTRPGETWRYSGGGYQVVQQLIEDVTGRPFQDWMNERIFVPTGMTHSGYEQRLAAAQTDHAFGHDGRGTLVEGGPYIYPEQAAAGLWTTPDDLALALIRVQRALSGVEGEIAQAGARRMLAEVKPGHALGFDVGRSLDDRWFSKSGDTQGFGAFMVAFESGDGAVVMANGANGAALAQDVVRAIAVVYDWDAFKSRERTAVALNEGQMSRLEGRYRYRNTGEFSVRVVDGRLTLSSPGEEPELAYAASANELFGLSQDATFVFESANGPARRGYIQLGTARLAFEKIE